MPFLWRCSEYCIENCTEDYIEPYKSLRITRIHLSFINNQHFEFYRTWRSFANLLVWKQLLVMVFQSVVNFHRNKDLNLGCRKAESINVESSRLAFVGPTLRAVWRPHLAVSISECPVGKGIILYWLGKHVLGCCQSISLIFYGKKSMIRFWRYVASAKWATMPCIS